MHTALAIYPGLYVLQSDPRHCWVTLSRSASQGLLASVCGSPKCSTVPSGMVMLVTLLPSFSARLISVPTLDLRRRGCGCGCDGVPAPKAVGAAAELSGNGTFLGVRTLSRGRPKAAAARDRSARGKGLRESNGCSAALIQARWNSITSDSRSAAMTL